MVMGNHQTKGRILIADDDPAILRLTSALVKREEYEPVTVNDGREAYHLLQTDAKFIAAIFDLQMPHLSGSEVVQHMQTENRLKRIPVMIMTAEQNLKLPGESYAAGAMLFLPKPFTVANFQVMFRILTDKAKRIQT